MWLPGWRAWNARCGFACPVGWRNRLHWPPIDATRRSDQLQLLQPAWSSLRTMMRPCTGMPVGRSILTIDRVTRIPRYAALRDVPPPLAHVYPPRATADGFVGSML